MSQHYKNAIAAVAHIQTQDQAVLCQILTDLAKTNPKAVYDAVQKVSPVGPTLDDEIRSMSNKIDAMKLYRSVTGAGLKESKEYVERIKDWV